MQHTAGMHLDSARAVAVGGGSLVAASLVGGAISVAAGVNSWSSAWTSEATLAAPWPMLLVQTAATVAAVQPGSRPAAIGSIVLVVSGSVSGISGFFDGQLGRTDLGPGYVLAQVGYVVVAGLAVACAAYRLITVRRDGRRRRS